MARPVRRFICNNCGAQYSSWAGRCTQCDEWNTIEEEVQIVSVTGTGLAKKATQGNRLSPESVGAAAKAKEDRMHTGIGDVDAVLGGGRTREASSDGTERSTPDVGSGFDQIGECFGLAESEGSGYGENPADDGIGRHGGSSAMGRKSCVVTTLLAQTHCGWNRHLPFTTPKLGMTQLGR